MHVAAAYRLGADGRVLPLSDYGLSEETAASYLAARERKLTLTDDMLELLEVLPAENFRVLIGIDDSSVADSIQKNEIACFRARLRPGDALLSGVDDLAFKAVTRLYLDETGWAGVRARVQYFGGTENQPACAYDSQPLTEILAEHFAFFDLTETPEGETPDLEVLVLTQPAEPERKSAYISALLQALKDCRSAGRPVILMDAGNGTYGTAFHSALTRETDLGWLLSYAGFLDMAIVTGTALSLGVARYARLTVSDPSAAENTAFAKTLADSIIKDFCYKNIVREDLLTFIRTDLGGDPNNFYLPEIDSGAVLARLKQGMQSAAKDVLQNLQHSNLIVSLSAYRASGGTEGLAGWGSITLSHYRFPWNRAFEIEMDMDLGGFTQPHKRLLGFWYR